MSISTKAFMPLSQRKKKQFKMVNSMTDMIRQNSKPSNFLQIENMVMDDMRKKILFDEMNDMKFYEIQPIEAQGKTHNDTNFRSIHFFQDVSQIRGTKFHAKLQRTDLEQQLREKISDEPGSLLLLREIYEKFEENKEYRKRQAKERKDHEHQSMKLNKKPETDTHLVVTLDSWHKQMKQQRALKNVQQEEDDDDIFLKRAKSMELKRKQTMTSSSTPKRGSMVNIQPQAPQMAFPSLIKKSEELQNAPQEKKMGSMFKQKMLSTLGNLTVEQKQSMNDNDRKVAKTVEKYLNQGEGLTRKDFEKLDQKKVSNTNEIVSDYSVEGLKRSLHTLIKMQITSFTNAHDRAQFYEKQSNQIVQSVQEKIKHQEQEIITKHQKLNLLRTENHEIHDKLRQIKTLLSQLQEELKQVSQHQKEQKLINKMQGTNPSSSVNRSNNIDSLMSIVSKQNEIEGDINVLKESYDGFNKKLAYNNSTIDQLENQILKLGKNNKSLLKALQGFLAELLLIGLDCRNSGLSWIIQSLWETGERVGEGDLPMFLDSKAREFLMNKTKKIMELGEMVQKSHDHFTHYKHQINYVPPQLDRTMQSITFDQHSIVHQPSVVSMSTFKDSFAMINSHQLKASQTLERRIKRNSEIDLLLHGVTPKEKKCIFHAMNEINTSKLTLNDLVYQEAQRKLGNIFKSVQEDPGLEKRSTLNESIPNEALQELKDKLIQEYADIQDSIKEKQTQLVKLEEIELQRMIKEIDFKNYLKRFNSDAMQVLAALFGYHKAEREIIKNGMMRKQ